MKRDVIVLDDEVLRLDRNESIFPSITREIISKATIDISDYYTYTSSYNVISSLSTVINCTSNNIHINYGSEQVLKLLVEVLECDEWVVPIPTFELFTFYCNLYGKKVITVPYTYDNAFSIRIPMENQQERGLYIVTPHNPTGHTFNITEIKGFCKSYKYVIVDEAYISPLSPIQQIELPDNLIIVRTFSKMGGLTGMRFGFCISSNEQLISLINQHRPMFLNSITLKLVMCILSDPQILTSILQQITLVKSKLTHLNIKASAGNFILLNNTPTFKGKSLKEYVFNNQKYHRMTIPDMETFLSL